MSWEYFYCPSAKWHDICCLGRLFSKEESSPVHRLLRHSTECHHDRRKGKNVIHEKTWKAKRFFNLTAIEHSTNYYEELRGGHSSEGTWRWTFLFFGILRTTSPSSASYALLFSASWHRSMSMTETCDHLSQNFPATAAEAPSAPRLLINAQLQLLQAQHNTESNKPTLDNKARM